MRNYLLYLSSRVSKLRYTHDIHIHKAIYEVNSSVAAAFLLLVRVITALRHGSTNEMHMRLLVRVICHNVLYCLHVLLMYVL
jgi:hypothetical protein